MQEDSGLPWHIMEVSQCGNALGENGNPQLLRGKDFMVP